MSENASPTNENHVPTSLAHEESPFARQADAVVAPVFEQAEHPATAGSMLAHARHTAGMEIDTLAGMLKVSSKKIEAIEQNRWQDLPDLTFVRTLVGSICRILKVDANPILAHIPENPKTQPATPVVKADTTSYRDPREGEKKSLLDMVSWKALVLVVVLLLAAWLVLQLPALEQTAENQNPTANASPSTSSETKPVTTESSISASAPVAASASTATEESNAPAAPPVSTPAPASTSASGGALVFHAQASTWLTVRDGTGKEIFARTLAVDETVNVSGASPLTVTLGKADSVKVSWKGQPFDLTPHTSGNVARFEVK